MKGRLLLASIVIALFLLPLYVCPSGYAQEKVITLKYSNTFPAANKISAIPDTWCKEVEKRTNGRVKVTHFPGATLTPPVQTYDSVVKGIADVGLSFCSYTRGKFPLTEAVDLPLGIKSGLHGTKMANEYFKKFKPKEFDEVKVAYLATSPPHILFTKKPVNNLEEIKGLKIRSTGTSAKVVQALGGAPVGMPMGEAYDALSKGVAEGIVCPYEPMKGYNLAETVSYCTPYEQVYANVSFVVINKDKWNAISKADQQIIEKINEEWAEKHAKLWDELNVEAKDVFLQKGGKILMLSKEENARWSARLRPILDEYLKDMKAKGLPGDEALKFCLDYLKTN
jgi:TRAP-type C4-dicarboxylate transport system substrate-binding protein